VSATVRAALIAAWVLAIGLAAVYLEVENVRTGARTRDLLLERDARTERVRRLEMRYNRLVSPDLLEKGLPAEMKEDAPALGARVAVPAARRNP
jgi:hypothetical protein